MQYNMKNEKNNIRTRKIFSLIAALLVLALSLIAFSGCKQLPFAVSVCEEADDGSAVLNTDLFYLNKRGINVGDTVAVSFIESPLREASDFDESLVLVVDQLVEEEGKVQLLCDTSDGSVRLVMYNGNFMEAYKVSVGDMVKFGKK